MVVRYSGYMVKTRQQAAWLCVAVLVLLVSMLILRATTQPARVIVALSLLVMAPFAIAHQAWRFLAEQERLHQEPTPGMTFAFRFLASTPVALGGLLMALLSALR